MILAVNKLYNIDQILNLFLPLVDTFNCIIWTTLESGPQLGHLIVPPLLWNRRLSDTERNYPTLACAYAAERERGREREREGERGGLVACPNVATVLVLVRSLTGSERVIRHEKTGHCSTDSNTKLPNPSL